MTLPVQIALPSIQSLHVTAVSGSNDLSQGTGFVVHHHNRYWLVTNWHIAAGRRPDDGQPMHSSGATPDLLRVWHNAAAMGQWRAAEYRLLDDAGQPMWAEHPVHRRHVDVVAMPVDAPAELGFYPHDLEGNGEESRLRAGVADDVSIIGFPFGLRAGGSIGVWSRGSIASEPGLDYNDLPCFLVDSRTRPGQSGSPVIVYSSGAGGHRTEGGLVFGPGAMTRLLGVYSGRINAESDLGFVWKTSALLDIVTHRIPGNGDLIPPRPL